MPDLISRWKDGIAQGSKAAFNRIAGLLGASEITPQLWEDLEGMLLGGDLGIDTTQSVLDELRRRAEKGGLRRADELRASLEAILLGQLDAPPALDYRPEPFVILVVGANGSGKTTTIAKLGHRLEQEGRRVLLVGADTFRAAAGDQLQVWAGRLGLPLVTGQPGSDPGAVVFDGLQSAKSRRAEVVLIDTAGRLHTRFNLMEELKKVRRVIEKNLPGAPQAVWLVLDATSGQNALVQSRTFATAVGVTGLLLAKLDSSARGGMVFAIRRALNLPVLYVGLGEGAEDLLPFDPTAFVKGILAG